MTGLVGLDAPADTRPPPPGGDPAEPQTDPVRSNPLRLLAVLAGLVVMGVVFGPVVFLLIVALIVSIFLHEMGHFVAARRSGMLVTEFFIGMGPRVWSFRRGEVEYGLKAFPLGAYVRIVGMNNLEDVEPALEDRTYRVKNYPRRLITVLAGPAVNIAIGVVLFFALFATTGVNNADNWTIGSVVADGPAQVAGIEPGDRITAVNGVAVGEWETFTTELNDRAGQQVVLDVERDGQQIEVPASLGWSLSETGVDALPTSPALPPRGSLAVAVDGTSVSSFDDFVAAVAGPGTYEVDFDINGGLYRAELTGPLELPGDGARGFLGVTRSGTGPDPVGVGQAGVEAVGMVGEVGSGMFQFLGRLFSPSGLAQYAQLFTGSNNADDTAGGVARAPLQPIGDAAPMPQAPTTMSQAEAEVRPLSLVGIVQVGDQLGSELGLVSIIFLLAMVNIFLGLINLLPLLPFDGGHATVATYEAVRGAIARRPYRIDTAKLMPATYVVVFILLGVGLSAMYLDIVNPVRLVP